MNLFNVRTKLLTTAVLYIGMFLVTVHSLNAQCNSPACNPIPTLDLCADGTMIILECETGLTNVSWYNGNGVRVGTGCQFEINNSYVGNGQVGQSMCFYYEATKMVSLLRLLLT